MTATLNGHALPDPATVLKRVDDRLARKAGDDPLPAETIDAFADAVRTQIVEPLAANPPDAAELAQLRADLQRLSAEVTDVRKQRGHLRAEVARLTEAANEAADARQLLEQSQAEVRKLTMQLTEANGAARSARAERDKARERLQEIQLELAEAKAALEERPAVDAATHRHAYPLNGPDQIPGPCIDCDKPFPWTEPGAEHAPDDAPDEPQPWGELFARIRRELALAWADDRKGAR